MSARLHTAFTVLGVVATVIVHTSAPSVVWARSSFHSSHSQNTYSVQGSNATASTGHVNTGAARDAATGQASGKRMHKPIEILSESTGTANQAPVGSHVGQQSAADKGSGSGDTDRMHLISNILQMLHDTRKGIIGNIR